MGLVRPVEVFLHQEEWLLGSDLAKEIARRNKERVLRTDFGQFVSIVDERRHGREFGRRAIVLDDLQPRAVGWGGGQIVAATREDQATFAQLPPQATP